jgi:hypothetical protein
MFSIQSSKESKEPWISNQSANNNDDLKSAREKASFKTKIPFNEDLYAILKTTIELLTKRINKKEKLSLEETKWFEKAINIIIDDANKYGPPLKPVSSSTNN